MRVVVVDDHALFRVGVLRTLEASPEWQVVGEARSAEGALPLIAAEQPEVVLMDLALPETDGVTAIRRIRRSSPRTRVLIMSAYDQVHDVLDALNAGAAGYALKSDGPEALVQGLRLVARGERYLAPVLAK